MLAFGVTVKIVTAVRPFSKTYPLTLRGPMTVVLGMVISAVARPFSAIVRVVIVCAERPVALKNRIAT